MKYLALSLIIILSSSSCKKGEDDPFLSVRSRKARLTNNWKLTQMNISSIETDNIFGDDVTYTVIQSFSDNNLSIKMTHSSGSTLEENYEYSKTLQINKDGTYTTITSTQGDVKTINDYWYWQNGNKKKDALQLDKIYNIKELRKDKLVLTWESSEETIYSGGGFSRTTLSGIMTFEPN